MATQNNDMILLITLGKVILKICLAWLCTLAVFQNLDKEIFEILINGTPSTIAQYLGFLYLIFIVVKKGIDTWKYWRIAKIKVKEEQEKHEQSKIDTDKKRKELDK